MSKTKQFLERYSRFLALLIIFLALTVLLWPNFLTSRNLLNILNQASLNVVIASGITMAMLVSGIDLSVGATLALTSSMAARFFLSGSVP